MLSTLIMWCLTHSLFHKEHQLKRQGDGRYQEPDVVNFRGEARISAGGKHKFPNPYYT